MIFLLLSFSVSGLDAKWIKWDQIGLNWVKLKPSDAIPSKKILACHVRVIPESYLPFTFLHFSEVLAISV